MKKRNILLIFIIFILCFIGCRKVPNNNSNSNNFNSRIATQRATQYMERLKRNDIEGANKISTKELATSNKIKDINNMPIVSFSSGNVVETGNSAYVTFYCSRAKGEVSDASLDMITLKIAKEDNEYKVSDMKSETIKQLYHKGSELRVTNKDMGNSELVLRLKDIPLEMYPKDQKPAIKIIKIPKDKFSIFGISYTGRNIALSTTDGKNSFIGVAVLEESGISEASAKPVNNLIAESNSSNEGIDENTLKQILEKPIAKKILAYDIIPDSSIKSMIFNEEDGNLIVQYTKGKGKGLGIKIYKNPDGELLEIDFEKIFPIDKYSINYQGATKNDIVIKVVSLKDKGDVSQELLGNYRIDLLEKTLEKI